MRIFGIIFAFALILPFVLPEPGSRGGTQYVTAANQADNPADNMAVKTSAELELENLIWAINVMDNGQGSKEARCLAQAIYFEARSEPVEGQLAVAQVVLNRVEDSRYPETICGVVFQNERMRHRCQFSFACDGLSDKPYEKTAWELAKRISFIALSGRWEDVTNAATHYHAEYVRPYWTNKLEPTGRFGKHIFYREGAP